MIPIFDSLSHPTLTGDWLQSGRDSSFGALSASLKTSGYVGAAAVGIYGVGEYEDKRFLNECQKYPHLVPVAGFNPSHTLSISDEMRRIKLLGYTAIKIHPRFNRINLEGPKLGQILAAAAEQQLIIFLCTYQHNTIERYPSEDSFISIVRALKAAPKAKVVLLHGGDVQVLRYAELVRFNPNLILDLSMTIMKYAGSSLENDISFLFRQFDRRICIGTDHPEYGHRELRTRFEELSAAIPFEKAENIAFRNISNFIGVKSLSRSA